MGRELISHEPRDGYRALVFVHGNYGLSQIEYRSIVLWCRQNREGAGDRTIQVVVWTTYKTRVLGSDSNQDWSEWGFAVHIGTQCVVQSCTSSSNCQRWQSCEQFRLQRFNQNLRWKHVTKCNRLILRCRWQCTTENWSAGFIYGFNRSRTESCDEVWNRDRSNVFYCDDLFVGRPCNRIQVGRLQGVMLIVTIAVDVKLATGPAVASS